MTVNIFVEKVSSIHLLPCPFCASDAVLELASGLSARPHYWVAHCLKCTASIEGTSEGITWESTEEEIKQYLKDEEKRVAEQWNRRRLFED